jgi:glucose/arabinose dehydrogenase
MAFNSGDNFPPEFKNSLFFTAYGARSNDPSIGKKIMRAEMTPLSTGYKINLTVFASGFIRPIDVIFDKQGIMYVVDEAAGNVYSIKAIYK